MSNVTDCNGVTAPQSPNGFKLIQTSDFFVRASLLHPLCVGTIAIAVLFLYLRFSSNRVVAPVTLFDWILNVALGSTLAGIVNGTSLVRGLIAIAVLMMFQFVNSQISSHYGRFLERAINAPPLVIAFRGKPLQKVMRHHRISRTDLNGALRKAGVWNIREVEVVIIEPTGQFSIYKQKDKPKDYDAEVLLDVPGYQKMVEHFDEKIGHMGTREIHDENRANEIAEQEA